MHCSKKRCTTRDPYRYNCNIWNAIWHCAIRKPDNEDSQSKEFGIEMLEMCERSQIWRRQCTRGDVTSAAYATPYRCNRQKYMIIVAIIISSVAILAQMVDRDTKKVTVRTQSMNGVTKGAFPNYAYSLAIIRMFNKISLIHCIPTVGNMFFPIRASPYLVSIGVKCQRYKPGTFYGSGS